MREVILEAPRNNRKVNKKPTIIPWKNTTMVADHSIRAVAREIMNMSSNQDLISVNMEGKQSTGKTELCKTIAHLVHQMDDEPFDVVHIGRKEFLNLEETVKTLKPMNNAIIFDDIAFLKAQATSKQISQIEYVLSVIRHLPGGKDVRIIIFKCFQYSKGLPPFLRQNDVTFVSSVDDNELKSLGDRFKKSMREINLLARMRTEIKMGSKNQAYFSYPLGNKGKMYHKYHAKNPMLPYFYWNGVSGRIVVAPLRTWIDEHCPICDDIKKNEESKQNLEEFVIDYETKYGGRANVTKAAIRIVMIKKGVNCLSNPVSAAVNFIEKHLDNKSIVLEELVETYNLKIKKHTRLTKQPDFIKKEINNLD